MVAKDEKGEEKKMTFFDEARALWGTMKMVSMTQEELARRLGVSQSYVANKLRLLRLPIEIQDEIVERGLSERHARALLRLGETDTLRGVLVRVAEDELTVSETEELVDAILSAKSTPSTDALSERLSRILSVYTRMFSSAKITRITEETANALKMTFVIEPPTVCNKMD